MSSSKLIEAIAVTAELCGRTFTPEAAAMFVADLAGHPERQVLAALQRCRQEVRGALTLHDVVSRVDDGRPGVEEAWSIALASRDESDSAVWTNEIAEAWNVARAVMDLGDKIGARMAFKESYTRVVEAARRERRPHAWTLSEGFDQARRAEVLRIAAQQGRAVAGAGHLLALPNPHGPVALLESAATASSAGLSQTARAAVQVMRDLLASRRQFMAAQVAGARHSTDELRAATLMQTEAYAAAHGIALPQPAPQARPVLPQKVSP
jgi:hypothetical protein